MNNIIKRWVEKLRSGEYQQGRGYLNKEGKFCCLGILCEIAVEDGKTSKGKYTSNTDILCYGNSEATTIPTKNILEWARLEGGFINDLVTANDNLCKNFNQIADMIEEHYA